MPSSSPTEAASSPPRRRIALAGNPNVGKTTVFNLLTGLRQKVGNYSGVTVEKKVGRLTGAEGIEVVDLPGTYSLNPRSLDEQVAYDVLVGRIPGEPVPDLVVCIADATNLERNLYLATQIADLGLPLLLVLNMMDEAEKAGLTIDVDALEEALGAPVLLLTASRGTGIDALRRALLADPPPPPPRTWTLMPPVAEAVGRLEERLAADAPDLPASFRFSEAVRALTNDDVLARWRDRAPGVAEAVARERDTLASSHVPYRQAEMIGRYGFLSPLAARTVSKAPATDERTFSDRVDAVLTHRIGGPVIFLGVLLLIFQAVFSWATPAMDAIEWGVGQIGTLTARALPDGLAESLIVDGVIAGVGNVIVFLPQILLLFFFLGMMEDTGYMARTAFIMDRLMRRAGLSGGSVVPLLSSFACAIPGIMAARTLPNHRDRVVTIMVAPLMSCSARLPVYTLFIAAFIPAGEMFGWIGYQGMAMFSMYLLGIVMAFTAAWVIKTYVVKGPSTFFVLELPPYRRPQLKQVLWRMTERSKIFITRAGKIIFGLSIVLWFLATFPRTEDPALEPGLENARTEYATTLDSLATTYDLPAGPDSAPAAWPEAALAERREAELLLEAREEALEDRAAGYRVRNSAIGLLGRALEPIMAPLGFDWKLSAGIVTAFAAREVIIATLATLYSVGEADETSVDLQEALRADRDPETGAPVYTPLVALSLLVFFVLALQCMSTLAIARRELNSWFWPAVMWTYMTGLAYLFALIVYQGGRWLGF